MKRCRAADKKDTEMIRGNWLLFLLALGLVLGFSQRAPLSAQETPLHKAAREGDKELAAGLLAEGADVNAKGNAGWTPLHLAAGKGHREVAELLLAEGGEQVCIM